MKYEVTARRIRQALSDAGLSAKELSELADIREASMSQYVNGYHKPSNLNAGKIGDVLGLNPLWLMGFDAPMVKPKPIPDYDNVRPTTVRRFPVLSSIACGEPILMQEEREVYIDASVDINADYILIAKGDSMTGARINDGDIVFIRSQPTVENGEIAAVAIDDEATLKRFYRYGDLVVLRAENPAYPEMQFTKKDGKELRILGKAVMFQSEVK